MSEQPPDSTEQGPNLGPQPLEYAGPNAPTPRAETFAPLSLGCLYAIVAMVMSFAIIAGNHSNSGTVFLAPAILLGGPFLVSLSVRNWRAFALGIGIMVGLVLLIVGTCSILLSH